VAGREPLGMGAIGGDRAVRRAAVLGRPIAHSLSPVLHRAAYRQLGLGWQYDAVEVGEADLGRFLAGCGPEWAGLSLTMPLKRAVLQLLDSASDLVELVGSANTVVFGPDGRRAGHNTDVVGIVEALRSIGAEPGPALVLGAGSTAASSIAALVSLGCPAVRVLARRPDAADHLRRLGASLGLDLLVGAWPGVGDRLPERSAASIVVCSAPAAAGDTLLHALPKAPGSLLDVSYAPWPPALVTAWRAAGGHAVAGDEMLLHQAVAQVELMTGQRPDVGVMRDALRAELRRRSS
jgi:shikimate dehydrogenase